MNDVLVIGGFITENDTTMEDLRLNSTFIPTSTEDEPDIRDLAMPYMMYKVGKCNILNILLHLSWISKRMIFS